MASNDNKSCTEFDTLTPRGFKKEKLLSASLRKYQSFCRRKTFSAFVASKRSSSPGEESSPLSWSCCGQTFREHSAINRHVARTHDAEIQQLTQPTYERWLHRLEEQPQSAEPVDISAWIPDTSHISEEQLLKGPGKVLLYYCYCQVEDPHVICTWQKTLCEKLHLTGKVRVATEGVNGTVGGTNVATELYIDAMCSHPLFKMDKADFKTSDGGAECFPDLRVSVYKEIVPMGVDPDVISYQMAGIHLEPEEFHKEVEALLAKGDLCDDTILLDCRNFYESKIGHFRQCLAPNIRKFSYFPDYVDQNLELFRDKKVLMYCTGGIRCERGSAYLHSKDVCKDVYQLKGGIHKYLERFPEGFYRGKLFVFDERYAISSNNDVISDCRYCGSPWDQYQLCSTQFCCQLVLSCPVCRRNGHTSCCSTCQRKEQLQSDTSSITAQRKEECECTDGRPRIPQDV
ncbi:thiosulfate sulfurtransferase/rhodanese-like domain-containing protein 2 [Thalassophryne amazonica]|uniref:thiosulfate sulfurtransferase/rhodanese-like domain-containing protein 2 n=1 Tax=Thalassophryne amazonica TaxID=390379 RepID=UPI0014722235|nr:thiosulfate sulfurtransferase/rhodanese-like domain-containing protein 2 [Thalassophryne amazonica]